MKRYRKPKLKEGEIKVYRGKLHKDRFPEIIYDIQGCDTIQGDKLKIGVDVLVKMFESENNAFKKPIIDVLRDRGFDLDTLKFSIRLKK